MTYRKIHIVHTGFHGETRMTLNVAIRASAGGRIPLTHTQATQLNRAGCPARKECCCGESLLSAVAKEDGKDAAGKVCYSIANPAEDTIFVKGRYGSQ